MDVLSPLQCIISLDIYKSILDRRSTTWKTYATTVRRAIPERSQRTRPAQNRHGKAEHISPPYQSFDNRSVRMRAGTRDGRPLPFPMQKVDSTPNRDATMCRNRQREYILPPRRKSSNRRRKMGPEHGGGPSNDTVRNSYRTT